MFIVDQRIQTSAFFLGAWPLSQIYLKNERNYPWFILIPRRENTQEIHQLTLNERELLIEEINQLSLLVHEQFNPDKLNIGALGNVVPQLHVHVVARFKRDLLWPQGLWQSALKEEPYSEDQSNILLPLWRDLIYKRFS